MNPFEIIGWIVVAGLALSVVSYVVIVAVSLATLGASTLRYRIARRRRAKALAKR